MAYSPNGFYGFPTMSDDALRGKDALYNAKLIGWLDEAVLEGDGFIQQDPNYDKMSEGMQYVSGDHTLGVGSAAGAPDDIGRFTVNLCRKAMQAHISALTDLKPTFGWRSLNPRYAHSAQLLNKTAIAWYLNSMADVQFGNVMKMAYAGGTADMMIEWNTSRGDGGDHMVIPKDPRDTIPIRPSRHGGVQEWQGVIFREAHSVNALRENYPNHAHLFDVSGDGILSQIKGLFLRTAPKLQSPADTLSGLSSPRGAGPMRGGDVLFYRCYINDRSRNLSSRPVIVGEPGTPWAYMVEPRELLYPRKRLILRTEKHIIFDGPNPYWHGKYPFVRFMPWQLPWFFFGQSALADLRPMQDSINRLGRGVLLGIEQWLNQSSVIDTNAVGETAARLYNARQPGTKIRVRGGVIDPLKAFTKLDGPSPQVLAMAGETFKNLTGLFEQLAGTGSLQELMQLKQMPAENTLERFYQAMTPELRTEGRMFEAFLRDASDQVLYNTFQFMKSTRRVHMLGDAGAALEDFDFDPDSLVPSVKPSMFDQATGLQVPNPEYDPEFDASRPRPVRAMAMAKLMAFVVAPNSVLAFNAQEQKMMNLQLSRQGYMDFWTLMETLEIPNVGEPPAMPLPVMRRPASADEAILGVQQGKYILGPPGPDGMPQLLEMRVPTTITERLQAQAMLGIGMTQNPAGRKASGGSEPQVESKDGGSRTTVTESEK